MAEATFAERLLAWFAGRKRDLPWRRSKNPYHVWVSEIMLQQTRVETVIPYFHRFIERFPTIEALAEAPEEDVLKLWEGLGYYSRARNLQAAVREVQATYGGQVPAEHESIMCLPGIGPYTAGAILSIAYGIPEPAVDGNVLRVMARYFCLYDDIAKGKTRTAIENLIRPLIPVAEAGDFTQALMELGSLVCTPRSPKCEQCPLAGDCRARANGVQHELPVKSKAKAPRVEYRLVGLVERETANGRELLMRRRADSGLLAGMWELPHMQVAEFSEEEWTGLRQDLQQTVGVKIELRDRLPDIEHVFSHIHWFMHVYRCSPADDSGAQSVHVLEMPDYQWVPLTELGRYAMPQVFIKIIRQGMLL